MLPEEYEASARALVLQCLHCLPVINVQGKVSHQQAWALRLTSAPAWPITKVLFLLADLCPKDKGMRDQLCHLFALFFSLPCSSVKDKSLHRVCVLYCAQKQVRLML